MITIREFLKASSLEEAWKANQKRPNRVLGGMGWMKMSSGNVSAAIDLSGLDLDQIQETEDEFVIGAMATLRQFETHEGLNAYFDHAAQESVRHIVGVQFRNCATMGGSVWLRAGFSDPLTLLLAMDCTVELYQGDGKLVQIPIAEFCRQKPDNSILTAVHIQKTGRKIVYQSFRNTGNRFSGADRSGQRQGRQILCGCRRASDACARSVRGQHSGTDRTGQGTAVPEQYPRIGRSIAGCCLAC